MVLSEHELRILRSLEDSLQECERQCAAIERRLRDRQLWLSTLYLAALITGVDLFLLGAIIGMDGLTVAGLAVVVGAGGRLGVLLHHGLCRQRAATELSPEAESS